MSPWGTEEKTIWLKQQLIKRSYQDEVLAQIEKLKSHYNVSQYGALSYNPERYPLYVVKSENWDENKKVILITGGVHGYETSGVHGAFSFMQHPACDYTDQFNLICFPCLSPWSYETINRWNPLALDPNRSFFPDSPAEECRYFLQAIKGLKVYAHFDLHETTNSDNTIFRPALEARDAVAQKFSEIPDGFYLVGEVQKPQREFQKAIIESVRAVTHIAPPDQQGKIIGVPLDQDGVIYYDMQSLFLCGGCADAEYSTTTEVYPDSPRASDALCIAAQVAAITGGLNYLLSSSARAE